MANPRTPEQWLEVLGKRLDARRPRLDKLLDYTSGRAPLPAGASNTKESYAAWQRISRTDYPNLIVDAVAERMVIAGFRAGDDNEDNDPARLLWRRSRMKSVSNDITRDMLKFGVAYGMASATPRGAILTRESPLACITDHDPLDPTVVRAGLKIFTDGDSDHAYLHLPGTVTKFVRASSNRRTSASRGWQPDGDSQDSGLPVVPIVRFLNRDGVGEFELHLDLIDRINWGILQRLLIVAMQAYRQRAIKDPNGELQEEDENGDPVDPSELFAPGPDALWVLPNGADIWESTPGDIQQVLNASKADIRELGSVTRTPMTTMLPDGENQTAEGALVGKEGLIYKVEDRQSRAEPSWDQLVGMGLMLDDEPADVSVQWAPAERLGLAEKADAVTKLAPSMPWRRIMTDVMGYPADEVDRMESERIADSLAALMANPAAIPTTTTTTPADSTTPAAVNTADREAAATLKARADALGSLIRAGVSQDDAAAMTGLDVSFIPGVPITLRVPQDA